MDFKTLKNHRLVIGLYFDSFGDLDFISGLLGCLIAGCSPIIIDRFAIPQN